MTDLSTPLPQFLKDVTGKYYGGSYWNDADYRVTIDVLDSADRFLLNVLSSTGYVVDHIRITDNQAEEIIRLAGTSEEADEVGLGIMHELTWRLGDDTNNITLKMAEFEEMRDWFLYALGYDTYTGSSEWEG